MANKRVNVLVYSGNGAAIESVKHCLYTFRRLLSPNYAVIPVTTEAILKEPWTSTCALLVMPGGADLPYCRALNGAGNRKISQYVNLGGAYLGLCAGGYYGSARCEFMVGDKRMEVVGDRELAFFPGTCRGLAFPGFVYQSEAGARAAEMKISRTALSSVGSSLVDTLRVYCNGGGVFVDANKFRDRGVEVLAEYTEPLHVESGDGSAAVVFRKVGDGAIVLTGTHPEFAAINIGKDKNDPGIQKLVEALEEDDEARSMFLKACFVKLGLQVSQGEHSVPSLSRLHLSSYEAAFINTIMTDLAEVITSEEGTEYLKGANDTFRIERSITQAMNDTTLDGNTASMKPDSDSTGIVDYNDIVKDIVIHDSDIPSAKETPFFNHNAFFSNLRHYQTSTKACEGTFGRCLLYGEVVTSTSTMLEKNPSLLNHLPTGFTATASTQVAGRGRGNNVWVSPPGSLMFSTVIKHAMSINTQAPVIFVQYLAALAIVEAVQTYAPGYSTIPVKLKWPNDIYALDPQSGGSGRDAFVKIGGILVNSSYSGEDYTVVAGIGLNMANAAPTTSLNVLAKQRKLEPFTAEKLLARILTCFEGVYNRFCSEGWSRDLEALYYKNWLHTEQIVTLEAEGSVRARVKGITRDWGLLLAEELGWNDAPTSKIWALQSDSNSFDFFKGLVKRKV